MQTLEKKSFRLDINKLKTVFVGFHLPTIKNLLLLVELIIEKRTTNLNKLKDAVPRLLENNLPATASNYQRLLRFFKHKKRKELTRQILSVNLRLISPGRIRLLVIDRTNWKLGAKNINLLTLGYIWNDIHIPLLWKQLNKQGNSNLKDRKSLFKQAISLCHIHDAMLLADREFIGDKWFSFLLQNRIHFMIRLKAEQYKRLIDSTIPVRFDKLKRKASGGRKLAHTTIVVKGYTLNYIILKNPQNNPEEPLLYFLTNRSTAARSKRLQVYLKRWAIETFFRHLKSNGFNLEDINFKDDDKIELMMALTCMAYCFSIKAAQGKNRQKMKTYASGQKYLAISTFRMGTAEFERQIFCLKDFIKHICLIL